MNITERPGVRRPRTHRDPGLGSDPRAGKAQPPGAAAHGLGQRASPAVRPVFRLRGQARKAALIAHVLSSVGCFGVTVAVVGCLVAARVTAQPSLRSCAVPGRGGVGVAFRARRPGCGCHGRTSRAGHQVWPDQVLVGCSQDPHRAHRRARDRGRLFGAQTRRVDSSGAADSGDQRSRRAGGQSALT